MAEYRICYRYDQGLSGESPKHCYTCVTIKFARTPREALDKFWKNYRNLRNPKIISVWLKLCIE